VKKGTIKKTLKNFGLSEKQAEIYIFLGKSGPLKGGEITKRLNMNKGQVYRILRKLEKKGLVEETLEFPARFTAVPLEAVIDSFVKSKREEAAHIEEAKKGLLSAWNKISQSELESSVEKFSVIEGKKKIFHKISQTINETNSQFSMKLTVSDLFEAEQFGVFDILNKHPMKSKIQFRVLTQLSKKNLNAIKLLNTKLKPKLDFRGKDPSLGSPTFTRMVIRDNDEIIFFISNKKGASLKDGKEVCLCTNCKSIIEAFLDIFEDSWKDSKDIEDQIIEIETGKTPPKTQVIKDPGAAKNIFYKILDSAEEEILVITSSNGLIGLINEKPRFRDWSNRGINIRIMAPIIGENLNVAQELLEFGEVRHVPMGFLGTTIIDGTHLFQFKNLPLEQETPVTMEHFENTFYTNDHEHIEKTENMLNNIWKNAYTPSTITLSAITRIDTPEDTSLSDKKMIAELKKIHGLDSKDVKLPRRFTEKALLNKFINAKRVPIKDLSKDPVTFYCSAGQAVIHPPKHFDLPHMLFHIFHLNKKSAFGAEDAMIITVRHETPNGYSYLPGAFITDNPEALAFWKKTFAGLPFEQHVVNKNEFHVQIQHNTLFAGWTVPIPLSPQQRILPPSCILIEGYGNIKTSKYTIREPSGDTIINEVNYSEAFVTFMHPSSKYTGPGTDGFFYREFLSTTYPPSTA
jgi:sugar-specific transcriptional regulator TrmB